jgi:hypothetical protein
MSAARGISGHIDLYRYRFGFRLTEHSPEDTGRFPRLIAPPLAPLEPRPERRSRGFLRVFVTSFATTIYVMFRELVGIRLGKKF